jgi:hypothetical protein
MQTSVARFKMTLILSGIFLTFACKPTINPQVQEYIDELPKADAVTVSVVSGGLLYYARRNTLTTSGNIIFGNWVFENSDAGCAPAATIGLSLSNIDHFDELGPCADGHVLVRATLK